MLLLHVLFRYISLSDVKTVISGILCERVDGMGNRKPILSVQEQILHLKNKGVRFDIICEKEAEEYLSCNNNYFKLTAYRKNYPKHPDGENKDRYIDLDFAYLVDLAIIDMKLRYTIVHMALDIEHHVKLQLLRLVEKECEDGYQIVQDYLNSLSDDQRAKYEGEINRNKENIYCGDIIRKYNGDYPIWALIEIVSFGRLIDLYRFCAERFDSKTMKNVYYRLLTCKEIRNAAAHSNCILNDLCSNTARHRTSIDVTSALMRINGMRSNFRKNRMSNARVQQIVTLLYMHKTMVCSEGLRSAECENLGKVKDRMFKNSDYYKNNQMIRNTIDFLKMIIDNWFFSE